jgi:1,4-alpha-glucan branching enzyme
MGATRTTRGKKKVAHSVTSERASGKSFPELETFFRGTHCRLHLWMGAHPSSDGKNTSFVTWAPGARAVSVVGDFNDWTPGRTPLARRDPSGIFQDVVKGVGVGSPYKLHVTHSSDEAAFKADPFSFRQEPHGTASMVASFEPTRKDGGWSQKRKPLERLDVPISIYEVSLSSWMRVPEEGHRSLTATEIAARLAAYVRELGCTHVQLLPLLDRVPHTIEGSPATCFFAPTGEIGPPRELQALVDTLHREGVGVLFTLPLSSFGTAEHGLGRFDGTPLFEGSTTSVEGSHRFDLARPEVRSYLLSCALFWLETYGGDGLCFRDTASFLATTGQGGKSAEERHLLAIDFLRTLNDTLAREAPWALRIAEDAAGLTSVTSPVRTGGLGFHLVHDRTFAPDTLEYLSQDPFFRKYQHQKIAARTCVPGGERVVLSLSHREVLPGHPSLFSRMPGDTWRKRANVRLLLALQHALPGAKQVFMGTELASWHAWRPESSIEWHLLEDPDHAGVKTMLRRLNELHREHTPLHTSSGTPGTFEWIDTLDDEQSVVSFLRRSADGKRTMAVACNFTPVPRQNYRIGVDRPGVWNEIFNSDAVEYGGSGHGNLGVVESAPVPCHGRPSSLVLTLPPLGAVMLLCNAKR